MNRTYCERETEIIQALRSGAVDPELTQHAASCAICADTLAVTEFLQTEFLQIDSAADSQCHSERSKESWRDLSPSKVDKNTQLCTALPDPDFLWWKAQLARKQMAVERATRSITLVRRASYLGAAIAGLWLLLSPGPLGSILGLLSKHEVWPASALTQSALFLGVAALVSTFLGSLYLARPEK